MQPYQEASQEARRRNLSPQNAMNAGLDLTSKMMPLLSQYVPPLLALKGLSSLNSGMGKFISAATKAGQQPDQIVDFIRQKASPSNERTQSEEEENPDNRPTSQDQQNIIQRLAPSVYQEMVQLINKGMNPMQAATKLKNGYGVFANSIKQIENETKADWLSIVESIFGKGNMAQPSEQQGQTQQGGSDWGQIMQMAQQFLG